MSDDFDYGLHYSQFHNSSDEHFNWQVEIELASLKQFFPDSRTGHALDVGCGMGFTLGALRKAGFTKISGVDIDASQVQQTTRRGFEVTKIENLSDYLDANQGKFRLITMLDVLEHIPIAQQISTAKGLYRALVPGGRLVVKVPNAYSVAASGWRYIDFTHVCSFTEHSLKPVLTSGGFERVEIPPLGNTVPRPSLRPSRLLTKDNRDQLRLWVVRRLWRQVLLAELGETARHLPLDLNLIAVADKAS